MKINQFHIAQSMGDNMYGNSPQFIKAFYCFVNSIALQKGGTTLNRQVLISQPPRQINNEFQILVGHDFIRENDPELNGKIHLFCIPELIGDNYATIHLRLTRKGNVLISGGEFMYFTINGKVTVPDVRHMLDRFNLCTLYKLRGFNPRMMYSNLIKDLKVKRSEIDNSI